MEALKNEAPKPRIAPSNAFVLTEWCYVLLQQFSQNAGLWKKWGLVVAQADALALDTCLASDAKDSIKHAALVVTRRALRWVFGSKAASEIAGKEAVNQMVTALTAKGSALAVRNAPFLGVIAGVCARNDILKPVLEGRKQDYYSFYVREIVGSKSVLPKHISEGLKDFFESFTTAEELQKEIIPAIEKALLRAPEIVLGGLVSQLLGSLPAGLDLSEILQKQLLKPLLTNLKSTNVAIRSGAVATFEAAAARSTNEDNVEKIADEILNPLKQSKVPSADQKVLYAQMLSVLRGSTALAKKISSGLAPVALKEANEAAMIAEVRAITKHVQYGFANGVPPEATVTDSFAKGIADKRVPIRRAWAISAGQLLWDMSDEELKQASVTSFAQQILPKLADTLTEINNNQIQAAQNGLVTVAYILTALSLQTFAKADDEKLKAVIKKTSIGSQALVAEPKPSFLLNSRVYTKLVAEDDLIWGARALGAVTGSITKPGTTPAVQSSWTQVFLYFITAVGLPSAARREATVALQKAYTDNPGVISNIVIDGIWRWYRSVESSEKDSAALAAKSGNSALHLALRSITLPPEQWKELGATIEKKTLEQQLIDLFVPTRPDIIPSVTWIEICLKCGADPGQLVTSNCPDCLDCITDVTEDPQNNAFPNIHEAAYRAAADLAFVAPEPAINLILKQLEDDLNPDQLINIGPTEAAIYRTPEGTAFIDVLASKSQSAHLDKGSHNYDDLKWEEELRTQLAAKKGTTRKLTADEQAKVKAQLEKESKIRQEVAQLVAKLKRGIGIIRSLATGPPTEAGLWIGSALNLLFGVIRGGAGLVVGDTATLAYLACAERISARLGPLRTFIGVATLRAMGTSHLPEELQEEDIGELITRVLYRLRFMGEQRPFDAVSLAYIFPLIFQVLEKGGVGRAAGDESDEQIVLCLEFLSFHTDVCSDDRLPRELLLSTLITSLQKYSQHYKVIKDCLHDLVHSVAPNASENELSVLVRGAIVPQVSVRTAVLQAIDEHVDLSDFSRSEEIWLACHDDVTENVELGRTIWEDSGFDITEDTVFQTLPYLEREDKQLRRAAARALTEAVSNIPDVFTKVMHRLHETYKEMAKPRKPQLDRYGMPLKTDMSDPWETRNGVALAYKELAEVFQADELLSFVTFLVDDGPLADRSGAVRDEMVEAATAVIATKGASKVEELMRFFEGVLERPDRSSEAFDQVNEAVIVLYGALARHLEPGDKRISGVVKRLLNALSTPSESVQYAVSQCLPPLVQASQQEASAYVQQMTDELLNSKKYASRRGAAYGLAGIIRGRGLLAIREYRLLSTLRAAAENKKEQNQRQGAYLAYELLCLILGRIFEPYVIQIVPQLLAGFGDTSADVRQACLDAAKTGFSTLTSYGVKQVLPQLLEGLEEQQWRSKKGACDSLGAMAYLDPQQLALSLPAIIPPLTNVLNDSHKEVRASAKRSLQRFGEVISNPEIKSVVDILLKALSDPTKYTDDALDSLIKVSFVHYLDAPSLALVARILERGLSDRSATKRKAAQIIGSLAHLTERKDLVSHLPILVAGLRVATVDPVPTTRATASKALGSLVEKLGEDAFPDLIPSLMSTLKSDTGAGDRLGSAQALSEVLAGLGTGRLEETLPTILQNVTSSKPAIREGFMSLFIFLPACFGNSFSNYLSKIIPPILSGLADDLESIRETALRAGRLLVKNFSSRAIDLLLPELERGLADDSHRIRLSSVELVGDLLFNLTGITAKAEQDEEVEENATEAGQSLLEVLGEERRNRVLSALYICRCDTSGLVRTAAVNVWKALVASPRTLKELIPTLTQLIIRRLASSNMEQKVIASNALGELIRKAGEGVMATLLPTLQEGLQSTTDTDAKEGICIALRELISSAAPEVLEEYEKTLISVVRTALVEPNAEVRDAAAEAFDALQKILGKKAVDHVLPYLLNLLRDKDEAENALSALLTLLTDYTRSNIILPTLLPTLLTTPMTAFNARAIASLAEVASGAMVRRLPNILNTLMDNIITTKDEQLRSELDACFDAVLLSVDEADGLNTAMSVMLTLVKNDDHNKRRSADLHLAKFFEGVDIDISRYYPDLIRSLLIAFDDSDKDVVKAAWTALTELTKRLKKEEMELLVISTRQVLLQVGVAGHELPGFNLPKGINAILPIFLQGLMNGTAEQRTQAALAISDIIDRTSGDALKPFVTQITGPLIRVVSERSTDVKSAILYTLNNLLEKIPTFLKPFLPQLQRTFAKSLADTSSEVLRTRAAKALGTLITLTPRIDPLIAELVTGSKTSDQGVKNAMLKALFEVVSKAGANMNEASRTSILGLIDTDSADADGMNPVYVLCSC